MDDWSRIRDGLVDLWDWWGEGVHLRPQPHRRPKSHEHDWLPPFASDVAREARFHAAKDIRPPPIRVTTVDAHLGDGLCLLNVVVHEVLLKTDAKADAVCATGASKEPIVRRSQSASPRGLRFSPGGNQAAYWRLYVHRICAAGYRPAGEFPAAAYLAGADLSDANLARANLTDADLTDANLTDANLTDADLTDAYLRDVRLRDANLSGADLSGDTVDIDTPTREQLEQIAPEKRPDLLESPGSL